MDTDAFSFHSSEPGHLSFRELMDGSCKLCAHLLVGQFADDVLCDEFVFETVIYKVFCGNRLVLGREGWM